MKTGREPQYGSTILNSHRPMKALAQLLAGRYHTLSSAVSRLSLWQYSV